MQTIPRSKIAKELDAFCAKFPTFTDAAEKLGITLAQLSTARNDSSSVIPAKALDKLGYAYAPFYFRAADIKVIRQNEEAAAKASKKAPAKKPAKKAAPKKATPKKKPAKKAAPRSKPVAKKSQASAKPKAGKPAPAPAVVQRRHVAPIRHVETDHETADRVVEINSNSDVF